MSSRHYTWKMDPKSAATPILLDADDAAKCRFCFMGEFGYELVSWLPYLLFLKRKLGIPIRTMGRVGSSVFYYFSDDHIELDIPPGDCWGELDLYDRIAAAHPGQRVVAVAHGGVIGAAMTIAVESNRGFAFAGADNGSVSHLIVIDGRWILRRFNDTSHLHTGFDLPSLDTAPTSGFSA